MKKILNRMALALAGIGLLAGSASTDQPSKLHDEVRHRVINEIGVEQVSADAVRDALGKDPHFGLLLEYYLERSMKACPTSHLLDDAVQETMLKIWKGQPQVFLKPHDEFMKYFQASTKRNYITEIKKGNRWEEKGRAKLLDAAEVSQSRFRDPAEEAATRDLRNELSSRFSQTDLNVLDAYLSGITSQRMIAEEIGLSRYAVGQSTENIKQALRTLLEDNDAECEQE